MTLSKIRQMFLVLHSKTYELILEQIDARIARKIRGEANRSLTAHEI